jgi:hypothetical protein
MTNDKPIQPSVSFCSFAEKKNHKKATAKETYNGVVLPSEWN